MTIERSLVLFRRFRSTHAGVLAQPLNDLNSSRAIEPTVRPSKAMVIAFWVVTGLFCLEMSFTAYYELVMLPDAADAFARLGFPADSFRVQLSWAKVVGVLALLVPAVPARIKEWAYAGFAFNLVSALIAHASIGDIPLAFVPATITSVLWIASYSLWRSLQKT